MIYILLLEKDKYYVGYTARRDGERFQEHFEGRGAKWTQKYKPVIVLEWRIGTEQDENEVTLELMKKYGWTNVRGGKWCQVEMTKPPKRLLTQMIAAAHQPEEACCATKDIKEHSPSTSNKKRAASKRKTTEKPLTLEVSLAKETSKKAAATSKETPVKATVKKSTMTERQYLEPLPEKPVKKRPVKTVVPAKWEYIRLPENLTKKELTCVSQMIQRGKGERIELIYLANPEKAITPSINRLVCVTSTRLITCEMGMIHQILVKALMDVQHERNFIRWDNIVCFLKDGTREKVGIYDSFSCELFCLHLKEAMAR